MKIGFYPKIAADGIRKNKRFYLPYMLTGCAMVMMYYIMCFLVHSPSLQRMTGGAILMTMLPLGYAVLALFSILFLFYSNSFLMKQRYREFGLYNILGMNKRNICKIMAWECLFIALSAISAGLALGIALSKAAELLVINLLNLDVVFDFVISTDALLETALIYAMIYFLLFINSLLKVGRSKPLELIQSTKTGESVPKRTWIFSALGVLFLTAAYYLAVSIKEPLTAFLWFFIAVMLVIAGTYLLFISGSVTVCRLLQRNKTYYYKANRFVSVSSMVYRMKRNGAGLASICILLTMVLVMISSTSCLYFGSADSLKARCPNSINISVTFDKPEGISDECLDGLRSIIGKYSPDGAMLTGVRTAEVPGFITENGIMLDRTNVGTMLSYDKVGYLSVLQLDDYNRMMNESKTLEDNECLIYCKRLQYKWSTFTPELGNTYTVKEHLDDFNPDGDTLALVTPVVYMVVKDINKFAQPYFDLKNEAGEPMMVYDWRCGFDTETVEEESVLCDELHKAIKTFDFSDFSDSFSYSVDSREERRLNFFDMYGSLFFLGITLSTVFLMAAVLIIYYKQICEGYEDEKRFEIMQKVGMTKQNIRKSINSQMLTVFFLPLLLAGVHLAFAFPFTMKIFSMFAFGNTLLAVIVNLICFAVFGIFYAIVYKITSGAYYSIVSGKRELD